MYENYCRIQSGHFHYLEIYPMEFSVHTGSLYARVRVLIRPRLPLFNKRRFDEQPKKHPFWIVKKG